MSRKKKIKNHRKKRSFFRILLTSVVIFSILGFGIIYAFDILNKANNVVIPKDDIGLGIDNSLIANEDVTNIALFGIDQSDSILDGRSDSIIIASIDKVHKKIKLTSIMRDTYVDIPGYGMDKINHAHSFGGPELAIKTINRNFNMNIRDFVTVDFFGLESIIDTLGGLEIDVKANEVEYINMGVRNMNAIDGKTDGQLENSGLQTITGRQAVAYSRIRKTGDGDFERTERQRLVLDKVIHKGLNVGLTTYPSLINTTSSFVTTSLGNKDMLLLGTLIFSSGIDDVDKYRLPVDGYFNAESIDGIYYLVPDTLEDNIKALKSYIYDDIKAN